MQTLTPQAIAILKAAGMTEEQILHMPDANFAAVAAATQASAPVAAALPSGKTDYKDFDGRDSDIQFVVLAKDINSTKWRPVHHSIAMNSKPKEQVGKGLPFLLWDKTAGAVDFINDREHLSALGTQYQIKNRKGEIV